MCFCGTSMLSQLDFVPGRSLMHARNIGLQRHRHELVAAAEGWVRPRATANGLHSRSTAFRSCGTRQSHIVSTVGDRSIPVGEPSTPSLTPYTLFGNCFTMPSVSASAIGIAWSTIL